jgi:AcrR family transcriptional regulator
MTDTVDRRIRRTRKALAAALVGLAAERPYESILVRDITERADVGYATFYRHFQGKDDLMLAVFDEVTADLEAAAGSPGAGYFEQEGRLLFEHVQQHAGLYRGLLASPPFAQQLRQRLAQRVSVHLRRQAPRAGELAFPLPVAANHMAAALLGLIEWWLGQARPLSVAAMGRLYDRLIIRATWQALEAGRALRLPWEA